MEDISLHILDIAENSITANSRNIEIKLIEDDRNNILTLEIKDDGDGMDTEMKNKVNDPFFTTKENKKVGLGLAFLSQSAEEAGGNIEIESIINKGTKIVATFELTHIDRKPIGKVEETMNCLKLTHPEINFSYEHIINPDK